MKNQFLKIFLLILCAFSFSSCYYLQTLKEEQRIRRVAKLYTNDAHYLLIDSVHNTLEKGRKFEKLKQKFLKTWLDSGNCYIRYMPVTGERETKWDPKRIREIDVVNILHTPNYDTLLILVTWLSGTEGYYETVSQPLNILIDSVGNWEYRCVGTIYRISLAGNQIARLSLDIRRLMIKAKYLTEDKKQDPTFFHRVYTDRKIWFKDWDIDPPEEE